ncbi:cyanoexosortase A [Anabaena subtropica]|uniref:Cyanoexosortase A n=1 Tax=Anabaena subtropica FACHB-260 TaxID=2692884 RepID=A0ABR8CUM9_9NOST|nr:cyanoexosortase A [Anabaena subtropica]MBD2345495.1 cyanoexosortase A [Anabaena subtropica FACHB-260]
MQNILGTSLKNAELWLLGIGGSLIAINLTMVIRKDEPTDLYINVLFMFVIYSLLKEKKQKLNLESGFFSSLIGVFLISLIFIISLLQINIGILSLLPPLISGFGIALLASGYRGLKQYYKELSLLGFLCLRNFIFLLPDISILTAKLSGAILWYTGFKVTRSGIIISLPTGSIEVYSGCAGLDIIIDLLSLVVLFVFMFDIKSQQKFILPIVAIMIGFIVNGFRVALMAILVAQGDRQAFEYWHEGDGSLLFSMIASLFLCLFCWFLLSSNEKESKNNTNY